MKSPAHQKAFSIVTSHPDVLLDDEPLDPLIDDIAAAIDAAYKSGVSASIDVVKSWPWAITEALADKLSKLLTRRD